MKVKPIGKVLIIVVLAVVAFFIVRNYQAKHPSAPTPIAKVDSNATVQPAPDSTIARPADTQTTVGHESSPAKLQPVNHTEQRPKETMTIKKTTPNHKKEKGDGRENLDLKNF